MSFLMAYYAFIKLSIIPPMCAHQYCSHRARPPYTSLLQVGTIMDGFKKLERRLAVAKQKQEEKQQQQKHF